MDPDSHDRDTVVRKDWQTEYLDEPEKVEVRGVQQDRLRGALTSFCMHLDGGADVEDRLDIHVSDVFRSGAAEEGQTDRLKMVMKPAMVSPLLADAAGLLAPMRPGVQKRPVTEAEDQLPSHKRSGSTG